MMYLYDVPYVRLSSAEVRYWTEVVSILKSHGVTEVEQICQEGDLNRICRWMNTDQWRVFQKKVYPCLSIKMQEELELEWVTNI